MTGRRAFIATIAFGTVATSVVGGAQEVRKPRYVGYLNFGSREDSAHLLLAFEERMAELGYVRGRDLLVVSPHPGGNVTGVSSDVTVEIWAERLGFLKEALPGLSRIALFWNPTDEARQAYANAAEEALGSSALRFIERRSGVPWTSQQHSPRWQRSEWALS